MTPDREDFSLASQAPSYVVVSDAEVEENRGAVAFCSSVKRRGVWYLPRQFRLVAVMGEAVLDLREMRLGEGYSSIELFAFWASVEIIVPPGIRVEVQDSALMAEIDSEAHMNEWVAPNAPTIVVRGTVIMSGVSVKLRYVGETERDAKKRRKRRRLPR